MENVELKEVVACVLKFNEKFLILKRAPWMRLHPNLWGIAAGSIEKNESPQQAAERELFEETGQKLAAIKAGKPFKVKERTREFNVHTFLFEASDEKVKISGEHIAFKWIKPNEIFDHKTIPMLGKDFQSVGIEVGEPAQQKLF